MAYILNAHSLIVGEDSAACDSLHFGVLAFDLAEKLVEIFDLVPINRLVVLQFRLERLARKLVFYQRHADSLRYVRNDLHADRLKHMAVQFCWLGWV